MIPKSDFMDLQKQLQENNEDLNSYIRDLDSWQDEMHAKDTQLSDNAVFNKKVSSTDSSVNVLNQPESKSSKKSIDSNKNNDLNSLHLIQKAVVEKDKGNEFFKKGEYQRAVDCYTEGLKCDPKSAILAANRGMALLKLNREKEAEKDCTLAIMLDPNYAKAYIRRAYARSGLKRYSDAINDYEKVLQIEPKNKMAKTEIEKLIRKKDEAKNNNSNKEKTTKSKSSFEENMKNAFLKGNKMPAKEVSSKSEVIHSQDTNSTLLKEVSTKRIDSNIIYPVEIPPHLRSKKPLKRINIVDVLDKQISNDVGTQSNKQDINSNETVDNDLSKSLEEIVQLSESEYIPKKLVKPKTALQFYSTWRSLRNESEQGRFLALIPPKDFISLFKHSLESDVFSSMIQVMESQFLTNAELKTMFLIYYSDFRKFKECQCC
ncbi:uncharacterized protein [Lepeophtheirus salmonis]|uniref:uncharacterized protein n=1 Tax=Lepeophtheirus salmonis TaxID=72036 RepID=UPI001AE680F5|nr:RNA polymerase II-associated protein 3-like [Lepeophtheirus salmonis]